MKVKILGEKMIAQCPGCSAIKMETNNSYCKFVWQKTFVKFPNLPEEQCYSCKSDGKVESQQI